jgi:hypothetical protein
VSDEPNAEVQRRGVGFELSITAGRRAPHVSDNDSLGGALWSREKRSSRLGHLLDRVRAPDDPAAPESPAAGDTRNGSRP